jgi:outer membrane protein assembly factor BamD (BamD/ComL family)
MVEKNPYGPRADEAQFRIAQYYAGKRHHLDAAQAYALVASQYKDSRFREDALFLKAREYYLLNEGPRRDPLPYEEARAALESYLAEYPQGRFVADAEALKAVIEDALAQKKFLIAEYYRKQRKTGAALRYYRYVVRHYADSTWAAKAKVWLPAEEQAPEPPAVVEKTSQPTAPAEGTERTEETPDTRAEDNGEISK